MELHVKVIPDSKNFSINFGGEYITIRVKAEPEKGKANLEIIKEFAKLGFNARIVKGMKSKRKVVYIEGEEEQILQALKERADD